MKFIILITAQESALRTVKDFIPKDYLLLEGTVDQKGLQMLIEVATSVVLVDSSAQGALSWVEKARRLRPDLTYLGLAHTADDALSFAGTEYFYDLIWAPFKSRNISMILERTQERERLRWEVENYKKMHVAAPAAGKPVTADQAPQSYHSRERVLREFSRALNSNFDHHRFLELFMNAVMELIPVGKLSILLYEEDLEEYKIAAQRGLDPDLCAGLHFTPFAELLLWLSREGRILHPGEVSKAPAAVLKGISEEMQLLQAVVCIPLLAHGHLVGTLNLGPKITGSPFSESELETLYVFCGNVAIALRDIRLHHEIRNQKLFTENILQHMNSGVVAINKEERIHTFNPRAGELLSLTPQQVIGKDLRLLPSPLGDLLYEAFTTGKALRKKEIELPYGRVHLEINTYRLLDAAGDSLGSVMIFDDLTPRKLLEKERRQAAQLDVLNKFVGQLAHEVKNPMVAVQTFTELLPEKYDDSSFREFYAKTVGQELKRLNELVEQLIAFSTPLSYNFGVVEPREILDLGFSFLQEQGMCQETTVEINGDFHNLKVRADKTLLARAFSYLLRYLFRAVEDGGVIRITAAAMEKNQPEGALHILLCDAQTKAAPASVEKMFDPLAAHPNGCISLGPPVSRKIIEDHGGQVRASLTRNNYLEIEVFLPIFSGEECWKDEKPQNNGC